MYDRAQRVLTQPVGSTTSTVGPGSYNVEMASKTRIKMDAYAPFGSLVERNTGLVDEEKIVTAPGPGYYDGLLPPPTHTKQGGVSLAYTSKRFQDVKERMPGPGAYDLPRARSEPDLKVRSAPAARTSRMKFLRNPEPPSIPIPRHAYGYEESDTGMLVKQGPPEEESPVGPASYAVPREELSRTTQKYRGIGFSKLTEKRSELFPVDYEIPGPGTYNPAVDKRHQKENINVNREVDQKQDRHHDLRFTEEVIKREEKQKLPGPGQYKLSRAFDSSEKEKPEAEVVPFGIQTKRFTAKIDPIPGPGSYNDPRIAFETLKRVTGLKRSPFGQTALRFGPGSEKTPGPAAYVLTDGIGQAPMRKQILEKRVSFGSSGTRGKPMVKAEEFNLPGPADYQPKERPFAPRYNTLSSMFSSMSSRFDGPSDQDPPPPGSYDVAKSYIKVSNPHMPRAPVTDDARRRRFAPGAAAARRPALNKIDETIPAPGAYEVASAPPGGRLPLGVSIGKSERFRPMNTEAPGPGTYTLAPAVRDSVWKPTFNILLGGTNTLASRPTASGLVTGSPELFSSAKITFLDASGRSRPSASSSVAKPPPPSAPHSAIAT